MESGFMSEFDAPIKYSVICVCAYLVFITAMPRRESRRRYVVGGFLSLIPAMFMTLLRDMLIPFHIVSMMAVFLLVMLAFFKLRPKEAISLTTVAFGFSYAAFFISTMLVIFVGVEYCNVALGDYTKSDIFFESALVHVVTVLIMQLLYLGMIYLLLRSKRLRGGLEHIFELGMSDVGIYMSVMILLSTTLFGLLYRLHINGTVSTVIWFVLVACIISLGFWVKREIKTAYIHDTITAENTLLEKSLKEKDKLLAELREDNDRLAGIIHKDNKMIPAMVLSVRRFASDMCEESVSQSKAKALEIAEQLENVYGQRRAALSSYEAHSSPLPPTGVVSVDAVLFYMAQKASESGIEFTVDISADVPEMLSVTIDRHEFNTILLDLVENALIAAQNSEEKAVSVGIGSEGNSRFLRVSDSGGAFDKTVLKHMGLKKITTRSDKGGSGTGLMNLFAVLRKYGASFSIEECPPDSRFTKSLTVAFDGQGRVVRDVCLTPKTV